jgi:pyruvate/2-oxoglutarate dehydrogenase complex dihydrolipoamide dehydrogenase (E3) component
MADQHFDALIIGSGQAGGPIATDFARAGRRTALIEREHVGGTCVNEGCTPTKTMVASARITYLARRAAEYGVITSDIAVNMARVRERKRSIVADFRSSGERSLGQAGVTFVAGEARLRDPHTVVVREQDGAERSLSADLIIINVGARPVKPDLPGLDDIPWLDSTSIMELDEVPEHLLVLGGGYIALEFGQMFRRFGSRVTIVQRGPQLLGREDDDVAEAVADILREDGIEVLLESSAVSVEGEAGAIRLDLRGPNGERTLRGSHMLVAVGRMPNTDRLNLPAAGVTTDKSGAIRVNERLETNVPGIYAIGDVKGGPAFTHISYDDYRILRANLLHGGSLTTAERQMPYTVFIDPQFGRVGLNEREAREQGRAVRVAKLPMAHVARALEVGETRGFMKAVVDDASDQILGFMCLGIEGGEVMSIVQVAMLGRLPYTALRDGIFGHPTLAESLNNLFTDLR